MSKVVIARKDKRIRHKLLHAIAFAVTGGASGVVTAAEAASHASYNARTRELEAGTTRPTRPGTYARDNTSVAPNFRWTPEAVEQMLSGQED